MKWRNTRSAVVADDQQIISLLCFSGMYDLLLNFISLKRIKLELAVFK